MEFRSEARQRRAKCLMVLSDDDELEELTSIVRSTRRPFIGASTCRRLLFLTARSSEQVLTVATVWVSPGSTVPWSDEGGLSKRKGYPQQRKLGKKKAANVASQRAAKTPKGTPVGRSGDSRTPSIPGFYPAWLSGRFPARFSARFSARFVAQRA